MLAETFTPRDRIGRLLAPLSGAQARHAGLALALGLLVGFMVLGARPLNPFDTSWIAGDAAISETGFIFMRRAALLVFPLTWSPALGYPFGAATANLDDIPLMAFAAKLLGLGFGPKLQILGPFFVLCAALQFHFGRRLSARLLGGGAAALIGGLFFLLAPPFIWRAHGHFALCGQFVILAALCQLIPPPGEPPLRHAWALPACSFVAAAIHPYLMLMVLGVAAVAAARPVLDGQGVRRPAAIFAASVATALASLIAFGFIVPGSGGTLAAGGWTAYGMDLLAPLDPEAYPSLLFRTHQLGPGQYEGYNYLGAGMLAIALVAACRMATGLRLPREVPLRLMLSLIAASALFAASTRVTLAGHVLVDVPLPNRALDMLSVVRASGRFFWPGYYALMCLALAGVRAPGWRPAALLAAALALQVADTASLRRDIHAQWADSRPQDGLHDPVWRELPRNHAHLSVRPEQVCEDTGPGGDGIQPLLSRYAALSGLTLDSFPSARDDARLTEAFCDNGAQFATRKLDPATAYVLAPGMLPALLSLAARNGLAGEHCGLADGLILCASGWGAPGIDPAVVARFLPPLAPGSVPLRGATPAAPVVLLSFDTADAAAIRTRGHESVLAFRLAAPDAAGTPITLLGGPALPGKAANQRVRVRAAGITLLDGMMAPGHGTLAFTVPPSAVSPEGVVSLTLELPDAMSPRDDGVNVDTRLFAIALQTLIIGP